MNPEKHHQPPHHIFWENHKKDNSNAIFKKSAESPKNPSRKGFKGQESFCNMKPSEHFELAKKLESSAGTDVSLKRQCIIMRWPQIMDLFKLNFA